jgi:hypothetical protein
MKASLTADHGPAFAKAPAGKPRTGEHEAPGT